MTLQAVIKVALLVQAMLYGCFGDDMDACDKEVQRYMSPGMSTKDCVRLLSGGSLKEMVESSKTCPSLGSTQVVTAICERLKNAAVAPPVEIVSSSTPSTTSTAAAAAAVVNEADDTDENNSTVPVTPEIADNNVVNNNNNDYDDDNNNDNNNDYNDNNNNNKGNKNGNNKGNNNNTSSTDSDDGVQGVRGQETTPAPVPVTVAPTSSVPRRAADLNLVMLALLSFALLARFP